MRMKKDFCNTFQNDESCKKFVNKIAHVGTDIKTLAVETYIKAWYQKMLKFYGKKGPLIFNYIDVFAGSGINYDGSNQKFSEGSAIRVLRYFYTQANNQPTLTFNVYLNDANSQAVNCLNCCIERKIGAIPKNLKIHSFNLDYIQFLNKLPITLLSDKRSCNLVFYDPFKVMFSWNSLKRLFSLERTDILINHLFPHDVKRAVKNVTNANRIDEFQEAYGKSIDELRAIQRIPNLEEKDYEYRALFENELRRHSKKRYIGYAPVIMNEINHVHIFDLVVASNSIQATVLLKDTLFTFHRGMQETSNTCQLSMNFEEYPVTRDTEFSFRYDIKSLGNQLVNEYGGHEFSTQEFQKLLEEHPFIPKNCRNELKKNGFVKYSNKVYTVSTLQQK